MPLTSEGLSIKRFPEILQELNDDLKAHLVKFLEDEGSAFHFEI